MINPISQLSFPRHLSVVLCLRYLRGKKIVFLSVVSVAMSCALLIVVASLFTGFIAAVENSASDHVGDVIITVPAGVRIPRYDEFVAELESSELVASATAVLNGQGLLHLGKGNVKAVRIWGIDLEKRALTLPFKEMLLEQSGADQISFTPSGSQVKAGGFVGIGVVARPDARTDEYDFDKVRECIGRKVALTTGTSKEGSKRKTLKFTVTDVVYSGVFLFDENMVYIPIDSLTKKLYPDEGRVADMMHIKLSDGVDPEAATAVVRGLWRKFAIEELNWSSYGVSLANINTSRSLQSAYVAELRKQMAMLMLIFGVVSTGVILLVFCIFYMIVVTKRKDIAIIKSSGLGSWSVAQLFVSFGLIIGVVGASLGAGLGWWVVHKINVVEQWISSAMGLKLWKSSTYMFSKIPNAVDWESVVWITCSAIVAAGIGALLPAIAAARVQPVRILRYE